MIRVRRAADAPVEEMPLAEFERRARCGEIGPRHEVCFPAVTGERFVPARELELFRSLYASGAITLQRYFHLGRVPYLTLLFIGLLLLVYFYWQGGATATASELARQGAKNRDLIWELGQWWRLLASNFLHASGWHLAGNLIFLFNLGGPTEAIFRRLDYLLVLFVSAVTAGLLSTLANPATSCGASGIVFGIWGAAAVFGARHRDILPPRYRRYFIGSVIPYSIFAMYAGFAMDGIDHWAHLGGLIGGSVTALFLPARLLEPRDDGAPAKLMLMGAICCLIGVGGLLPAGPGKLSEQRYFPAHGLVVPIPQGWRRLNSELLRRRQAMAFGNGAGVAVTIETRLEALSTDPSSIGRDFVEGDLAAQLSAGNVRGMRLADPVPVVVGELGGAMLTAELLVDEAPSTARIYVLSRGYYRYLVSFTAPSWLNDRYEGLFASMAMGAHAVLPDALDNAMRRNRAAPSLETAMALALNLAYSGRLDQALDMLADAERQWPASPMPHALRAQLLLHFQRELPRACADVKMALELGQRDVDVWLLASELFARCGDQHAADQVYDAMVQAAPDDPRVRERMRAQPPPQGLP